MQAHSVFKNIWCKKVSSMNRICGAKTFGVRTLGEQFQYIRTFSLNTFCATTTFTEKENSPRGPNLSSLNPLRRNIQERNSSSPRVLLVELL